MSKKNIGRQDVTLSDVKVDKVREKKRRNTDTAVPYEGGVKGIAKVSSRSSDFVYINSAYVGSLNSVNEVRLQEPPTSVYREQYWTCSKWSFAKKILAIAAGVLLGGAIGLALTLALRGGSADDVIGGLFPTSAPD